MIIDRNKKKIVREKELGEYSIWNLYKNLFSSLCRNKTCFFKCGYSLTNGHVK